MENEPCDWSVAAAHLRRVDEGLGKLVARHGLPTWKVTKRPFEHLTRAIVYQQLSGQAAGTIFDRFRGLFGGRFPSARALLACEVPRLRAVGLSNAKALAVRDLARHMAESRLNTKQLLNASNEAIAAELLPVRGIGPWSVDMYLMFGLSRPNVLPVGDLGVQKGMQAYFRLRALPTPAVMQARSAAWAPYRSLGAWLMWRVIDDLKAGLVSPKPARARKAATPPPRPKPQRQTAARRRSAQS